MYIITVLSQIKTILDSAKYIKWILRKRYIHIIFFVAIILGGFYYHKTKMQEYTNQLISSERYLTSIMNNVDFWLSHRQISDEVCDISISCGKGFFIGWLIMDLVGNKVIAYSLKEGRHTMTDGILKKTSKMDCTDILRDQNEISAGMMQRGIKIPPLAQKFENLDKNTIEYFQKLKHKEMVVLPKHMALELELKSLYEMYASSVTNVNSATFYPYKFEGNTIWVFYIAEDISISLKGKGGSFCSQRVVQRSYLENIAQITEKTFNIIKP